MVRTVRVEGVVLPEPGRAIRLEVAGRALALYNVDGTLRASDAGCPHVGGPLHRGRLVEGRIACPWHGSQFDLATGAVVRGPANVPLSVYPVKVEGDALEFTLP